MPASPDPAASRRPTAVSAERLGPWGPLLARAGAALVALVGLVGVGLAAQRPEPMEPLPEAASPLVAAGPAWTAPTPEPEPEPAARGAAPRPCKEVSVAPRGEPPGMHSAPAPLVDGAEPRVALNRASRAELQHLPGIGAKRAAAIVTLRARLGRFRRITDLLRVKGIGVRTLKRLAPLLTLDGDAPPGAASDARRPGDRARRTAEPAASRASSGGAH